MPKKVTKPTESSEPVTATTEPAVAAVTVTVTESAPVVSTEAAPVSTEEESFDKLMKTMSERLDNVHTFVKTMRMDMKELDKQHKKEIKSGKKSKRVSSGTKSLSGFNKPTPVPSSIVNFLELEDGASLPRTQITKRMYAYIKLNKLQDPQDKRTIMPDAKLKALFHLDDSEKVTFYNIQSHIKKLYPHVVKADSATESSASAVPVAVEASASALPSLAASSEAVSEEPKKGGGGGVKKKKPNVST